MALYRISALMEALEQMHRDGHEYAQVTQEDQNHWETFGGDAIYAEDAGLPEEIILDPENYDEGELDVEFFRDDQRCLHIDPLVTDGRGPYRFGHDQYIDSVLIRQSLVSGAGTMERPGEEG